MRGADRVFLEMCEIWPDADIFTPIYNEAGTEGNFAHRRVQTSFLQVLRPRRQTFRALLPFYPAAIESFDLSGYDVVVSSSSAWAHGVICDPGAVHVCYCHNPFRFAWNERHSTLADRRDPITRAAGRALFRRWRGWDWMAAQRVDRYLTNSETTRSRIASYFGRDRERGVPAGPRRAVLARRAGRPLPGGLGAGLAQADRRGRAGLRRTGCAAGRGRRRPGPARPASAGLAPGAVRRPRLRRRGGRADGHLPRVRGHGHGGVRDRRGRGAGRRPSGDRPPRRRRAGNGDRERDRLLLGGWRPASSRRPSAGSTRWPWTRRRAWTTRVASPATYSARGSWRRSPTPSGSSSGPGAQERQAVMQARVRAADRRARISRPR